MSSKTNTFPIEKLKKAPIRFGGFGNLFKHTHTHSINLFTRFRAEDKAFFATEQGRPVSLWRRGFES